MAARRANNSRSIPVVRYAPLIELLVYEVSEAELEQLASGPQGQIQLSFALALLPAALTVFVTLQTVEIHDWRIYSGYWIAFWLLLVQGVLSLARWWTTGNSTKSLVNDIRSRMPPTGIAVPPLPPVPDPENESKEP